MFSRNASSLSAFWRVTRRLRSCSGFTLTELIVIIVMVGLLATAAGMKSGSYDLRFQPQDGA